MASEAELQALAEQCEKASRPDRELDMAIYLGIGHRLTIDRSGETKPKDRYTGNPIPLFTASLDAAMQLVPEDRDWMVDNFDGPHHRRCSASVFNAKSDDYADYAACAPTPALALCAAALKARAATMAKEQSDG